MKRKLTSLFMCMAFLFPYTFGSTIADAPIHIDLQYAPIIAVEGGEDAFYLGSSPSNIVYGAGFVEYDNAIYTFKETGLYRIQGHVETCLTSDVGNDINIANGKLYYSTAYQDSTLIKVIDLSTEVCSVFLDTGEINISNLFVISDRLLMYLSNGIVYQYGFSEMVIERISPLDNVFSFIPTYGGNIYATGSLFDYTLYFSAVHLADGASFYDVSNGYFIMSLNGTINEIPLDELYSLCSGLSDASFSSEASDSVNVINDMTEYDQHGTYSAADLLNYSSDTPFCDSCETDPLDSSEITSIDGGFSNSYMQILILFYKIREEN